jgi:carboxyl-terminal processing protease
LDDYLIGQGELKPLGSLKLTIQKFYRINGGATQLKGVESDIVFPNSYSMVKNGEREQEYYLPWDEIKPVPYDLWSNPPNYESLRRNSKKRTDANPRFQLINENAKRLKAAQDDIFDPLNLAAYQTEQKRNKEEADKLKKEFEKEIPGFIVKTIKSEESYVKADSVRSKIHEDWKKELKKDTELFESMQILNEMK